MQDCVQPEFSEINARIEILRPMQDQISFLMWASVPEDDVGQRAKARPSGETLLRIGEPVTRAQIQFIMDRRRGP